MWILFGAVAVIAAILNIASALSGKSKGTEFFRFISLSFTALTLCAFYQADAGWVKSGDWAALLDVTPTMATALWILTGISIAVNGATLFIGKKK